MDSTSLRQSQEAKTGAGKMSLELVFLKCVYKASLTFLKRRNKSKKESYSLSSLPTAATTQFLGISIKALIPSQKHIKRRLNYFLHGLHQKQKHSQIYVGHSYKGDGNYKAHTICYITLPCLLTYGK